MLAEMERRQRCKGRRKPEVDEASSVLSGSAESNKFKHDDKTKTPSLLPPANPAVPSAQIPPVPPVVPPVPLPSRPSVPPSPPSPPPPTSQPPTSREPVRKGNGQVQDPPTQPVFSPAPTTLVKMPLPSARDAAAAAPVGGLAFLSAPGQPSDGPAVSILPRPTVLPGRTTAADPGAVADPPNYTWTAVCIVIGSIAGTVALGFLLALIFVRRRRRQSKSRSPQTLPYRTVSGPRAVAATPTTKSHAPWEEFTIRQQPTGPNGAAALLKPPAPLFSRYSNRSTGLSMLDEKQWRAYQNLTGQSNPKQAVPFNHPFYQRNEWR